MARRKIIRGGELPKQISGSGVTIDETKTLEEFVAEEEANEIGEALVPDNLATYHKTRTRYIDKTGHRGATRVYTRPEINAMNWEKIMENQKTIEGVITSLLLSGREVTGRELQNNCMRQLNVTKKKYSQRSTYMFHKTDLGKFIVSRRDGKGASYKLVAAALECKVDELVIFVYKGNKEGRAAVLEHHKGLAPYLEEKAEEKKDEASDKLSKKKEKQEKSTSDGIATAINNVVSQELGVNVSVDGRIEIVFKWE